MLKSGREVKAVRLGTEERAAGLFSKETNQMGRISSWVGSTSNEGRETCG